MSGAFDAIVVGGGVMGTAAARELAERGRNTLLLERFTFGHNRGSSGGPTRIFRFTYEHPDYVRMAGPALDAWRELEDVSGERLLHTTGGIDIGEGASKRFLPLEEARPPETCLYTNTPDGEFLLDRLGPIVVGSPCSGHGFKFAPLIGKILADMATGRPSACGSMRSAQAATGRVAT